MRIPSRHRDVGEISPPLTSDFVWVSLDNGAPQCSLFHTSSHVIRNRGRRIDDVCISASVKNFWKIDGIPPLRAGGGGSSKFLRFGFPRFRIFSFLSFFPSSRYDYGNSIEISVERKMRLVGIPRKTWCKEELNAKETRWYSVQISGKCSRFVDQCARRITQLGRKRDPRVLWKEWEEGLREGAVSIILLLSPVVSWWKTVIFFNNF